MLIEVNSQNDFGVKGFKIKWLSCEKDSSKFDEKVANISKILYIEIQNHQHVHVCFL